MGRYRSSGHEAKEAYRLTQLKSRFSSLSRGVTELSKEASDQLINQNFGHLFTEECDVLRAPSLKVQFVGRQGKPQRRKILTVDQKPSLVLSEGEQKVLAIADFLARGQTCRHHSARHLRRPGLQPRPPPH